MTHDAWWSPLHGVMGAGFRGVCKVDSGMDKASGKASSGFVPLLASFAADASAVQWSRARNVLTREDEREASSDNVELKNLVRGRKNIVPFPDGLEPSTEQRGEPPVGGRSADDEGG